jgi:hypothetical protein
MDVADLESRAPVLCLDTCSLLDVMRDPTRESAHPHDRQAALDLVQPAEAGRLTCLVADQVALEFAEHDLGVQEEARQNLMKLRRQIERVDRVAAVYGATGSVRLDHLDDHVARARALVGRWLAQVVQVTPTSAVPAAKGKDSSKDCLVYETYLEAVATLRAGGCQAPIVFLSSNTREYVSQGGVLKPEVAVEFGRLQFSLATGWGHAKHARGL